MKRGQPLQRRTPLTSSSGVRPRREQPRRMSGRSHGIGWDQTRAVIWLRSGGRCERCGTGFSQGTMEAHHRLPRRYGADCPCNALALCSRCHHDEVHGHPEAARAAGEIISQHDVRDAGQVPVVLWCWGMPVLLDCEGMVDLDVQEAPDT